MSIIDKIDDIDCEFYIMRFRARYIGNNNLICSNWDNKFN